MIVHWWSFLPGIEPEHAAYWAILDSLHSWAIVEWWLTEIYPTQRLVPWLLWELLAPPCWGCLSYNLP